jgi:hypothetical protein
MSGLSERPISGEARKEVTKGNDSQQLETEGRFGRTEWGVGICTETSEVIEGSAGRAHPRPAMVRKHSLLD